LTLLGQIHYYLSDFTESLAREERR
jgi:hypothetical protein